MAVIRSSLKVTASALGTEMSSITPLVKVGNRSLPWSII